MSTFSFQRKKLRWSIAFCFLLIYLFSACNTNEKVTTSRDSSCTALPTSLTSRGANTAVLANIPLRGHPFKAVASDDGQWIFVSVDGNNAASSGIAVLHKHGSQICLQRVIPLDGVPFGITLSHDNRILVIATTAI